MRRRAQVSQKLIATEAGVSQATVSLVLAGRRVSSEETRQRVLQTAEKLRYRANQPVAEVPGGATRMVGVMAPPYDFFWSRVLYGIHDVLAENDHVPITVWTKHFTVNTDRPNEYETSDMEQIHRLLDRRVDGLIFWPPFASVFSKYVREFSSRDLPVVTIDTILPGEFNADSVCSDEKAGTLMVAEHFLSEGHRHIGFLSSKAEASWAIERTNSFIAAIDQASRGRVGPAVRVTNIGIEQSDPRHGFEQGMQLLTMPDRPTAIFAATDAYARTLYHVAREVGLQIPRDLSVIGYSDDAFARDIEPGLTTVRQHGYDTGRKAAELILRRSVHGQKTPEPIRARIQVELIVRGSTAPPRI